MAIGISEYRQKVGGEKEIPLPSGAVFKIRKVTGRDFMSEGNFPVSSTRDIVQAKKEASAAWDNMASEQRKEKIKAMNGIIVMAVKEPKISLEPEEGKLCVKEINDTDYFALVEAISTFSMGGEELKSFRNGGASADIGRDGKEVGGDAPSDTGQPN